MAVARQARKVHRSVAPPSDNDWQTWAVIGAIAALTTIGAWLPAVVFAFG